MQLDNPAPELAWAALLHDIGKEPTFEVRDRIRFNRHDVVGAKMAEAICRRLRMSNARTERIVELVAQHMRIRNVPDMRESTRRRFLRQDCFFSFSNCIGPTVWDATESSICMRILSDAVGASERRAAATAAVGERSRPAGIGVGARSTRGAGPKPAGRGSIRGQYRESRPGARLGAQSLRSSFKTVGN